MQAAKQEDHYTKRLKDHPIIQNSKTENFII